MKLEPIRQGYVAKPVARLFDEATAAAYLGVGKTSFRSRWQSGDLPQPIRVGQRLLWDRVILDRYVDALSGLGASGNSWDDL